MKNNNTTIELLRLQEMRKNVSQLIALMIRDGFLSDGSEAIIMMDDAWRELFNEYASIREAQEADFDRSNLFGQSFIIGQKIRSKKQKSQL